MHVALALSAFLVVMLSWAPCPAAGGKGSDRNHVKYELIGEYDIARLDSILTNDLPQFTDEKPAFAPARYAVTLYKVTYATVIPEKGNRRTMATGLVAVPQTGAERFDVVSYQHGTVFSKTEVPSSPERSAETRLVLAAFAAQGNVVVAADYIGKGDSPEPDSYLVKDSTAQACFDMLQAARTVCEELGVVLDRLFLSGWSQGSYSTLVFLRKLEENGVPVAAMGTASTPNDLYLCLERWMSGKSPLDVNWLVGVTVLILGSYESYYGPGSLRSQAIKPEYLAAARGLYGNTMSWEAAEKVLPFSTRDLVRETFAGLGAVAGNDFFKKLQENSAYSWRFKTRTRFYYGKVDEVVPPYVATLPVEYQKTIGGAESQAVYAGDRANHRGTFVFGLADQVEWFRSLQGE
ncbi:MAG: alpha/beta hydrolase family protein [Acidobacteriota bacterium]